MIASDSLNVFGGKVLNRRSDRLKSPHGETLAICQLPGWELVRFPVQRKVESLRQQVLHLFKELTLRGALRHLQLFVIGGRFVAAVGFRDDHQRIILFFHFLIGKPARAAKFAPPEFKPDEISKEITSSI